ncbi:MAG: glucose 1-dehydrogenase [Nevskia sp.]|nr:glucose 1-dehydrogenase [Nevskia sp.]
MKGFDYGKAFRLDGKVALVTGAARGLGAEIARALAQVGASVLLSDVMEEQGRDTAARLREAGASVDFVRHDVTDEAQWEHAVAAAVTRFGGLDVLVNNAGIETAALITRCTVEDFRRTLDVNVVGTFLGIKHAVQAMSPGGSSGRGGSIINLSSAAGTVGVTTHAAYCTSKGAVRLLTKAAAVECGQLKTGIRVNSIHPAVIRTKMGDDFIRYFVDLGLAPDFAASEAAFLAALPMGHFGATDDVASAAIYLASEASKWVTGAELAVDGGFTAA